MAQTKLTKEKLLELLQEELTAIKEEEIVKGKRILPLGQELMKLNGTRPFGYKNEEFNPKYEVLTVYCPDITDPKLAYKLAQWLDNNSRCDLYYIKNRDHSVKTHNSKEADEILGLPETARELIRKAHNWWDLGEEFKEIVPDEQSCVTFYIFGDVLDVYNTVEDGKGKFVRLLEKSFIEK